MVREQDDYIIDVFDSAIDPPSLKLWRTRSADAAHLTAYTCDTFRRR